MDERNTYNQGQPDFGADMAQWEARERQLAAEREVKAARSHFSKLGGMFVLGTVVMCTVQIIPSLLVSLLYPQWLLNSDISMALSMLPLYLVGMPVLIVLVRTIPAQKVERRPMKAWQFLVAAIMCFAAVYITNIVGNLITMIIGALKGGIVQNQLANVTQSVSLWAIAFYMVFCAPVMEEYIFRKLIVDRTVRYGQATAVLLSGLMFGLFHGNLNQFVYAFVLGLFLAFLYVKTGNLKITIALHMMINFMGGFVSSLLMRTVDLDGLLSLMEEMDVEEMVAYMSANMVGIVAYGAFMVFIFGSMIAGLVLFIVCLAKRRFTFAKGAVTIPKGKRFRTIFLNVGMILYSLFWIVMIIVQLFA